MQFQQHSIACMWLPVSSNKHHWSVRRRHPEYLKCGKPFGSRGSTGELTALHKPNSLAGGEGASYPHPTAALGSSGLELRPLGPRKLRPYRFPASGVQLRSSFLAFKNFFAQTHFLYTKPITTNLQNSSVHGPPLALSTLLWRKLPSFQPRTEATVLHLNILIKL